MEQRFYGFEVIGREKMMRVTQMSALICAAAAISLLCPYESVRAATTTFHCMNTASGATWDVTVDYDRATVDSFPAKITSGKISWADTKGGGTYSLDRKSGALTLAMASSMGGNLWFHKCREQ